MKFLAYIFTNLGSEGPEGPANASFYLGTTLEGQVTLNAGIQMWQVPYTGTYIIESRGAAGANGTCYKRGGSARTWHRGGQPRSQGFSLFVIGKSGKGPGTGRSHDFQHPDIVGVNKL